MQSVEVNWTRGNRHKLEQEVLSKDKETSDQALAQVVQRACEAFSLEDLQKPSSHGPYKPALGDPAGVEGFNNMTPRGLFQPHSVILSASVLLKALCHSNSSVC